MSRPAFPEVIDSTMISQWRACRRKFQLSSLEHWRGGESVHLVAGRAFATGLEVMREQFFLHGAQPEDALALGVQALWQEYGTFECPVSIPKDALRMAGALEFYAERYPLGKDGAQPHLFPGGKHGIEFGFAEPLPVRHPVTGDPILFSGRADMAADAFGGLFLYDEKTTTRLGPTWINQWEHRSQFTAYCWGFRGAGYRPAGVVVRGISLLANGYDTLQAITYRSDWEIDRWLAQTVKDVQDMILAWQAGYFDYNLDHACTEFGGCQYLRVCKSPEPERWLPVYFKRIRWDPLTRLEIPMEAP